MDGLTRGALGWKARVTPADETLWRTCRRGHEQLVHRRIGSRQRARIVHLLVPAEREDRSCSGGEEATGEVIGSLTGDVRGRDGHARLGVSGGVAAVHEDD